MTSLDRPVVPEVGIATARSSGDAAFLLIQSIHIQHGMHSVPAAPTSLAYRLRDHRIEVGVGHHHNGFDLSEQPGEFRQAARRVHRDRDGTDAGQRQPGEQVLRCRPGGQHDQIAVADAEVAEYGRHPADQASGLAECSDSLVSAQPDAIAIALAGPLKEPGDRSGVLGHRGTESRLIGHG